MNAMLRTRDATRLSPGEVELIRAQFVLVARDADGFARDFYDALFSIAPLLRAMFRGPMPEQHAKLVRMLAMLMAQLSSPETLAAPLAALGERHRGYGVLALDYDRVGEALLQALDMHLGEDFDATARAAWGKLYLFVATTMRSTR